GASRLDVDSAHADQRCFEDAGRMSSEVCAERSRPWVLAATILGSSTAFIDGSVVTVALPAMQADLAAPVSQVQWIVNAYMLLLGALILIGGASGDRFGRRRIFIIGVLVFTAASVACGLAPNAAALVAAPAPPTVSWRARV